MLQFQTVWTLFPFLAACGLPILRTLHASIKPNNTLQPACETPTPCATLTWPSQPRLSVGSPSAMVFGRFNKCNMRPAHTAPATGGCLGSGLIPWQGMSHVGGWRAHMHTGAGSCCHRRWAAGSTNIT